MSIPEQRASAGGTRSDSVEIGSGIHGPDFPRRHILTRRKSVVTGAKPTRDLPEVYLFIIWSGFNAFELRRDVGREVFFCY